ncbi:unnamed protein product [Sphenostylis stenocarpa]|uniref:Uncharacterized protein n=1 Tax=Sphenostylis stenocarpa TaxID=92480 RepID=A0AA86W5B0_9FABA|nr:unnamed protein product [Sphenostylis stenocarpa]
MNAMFRMIQEDKMVVDPMMIGRVSRACGELKSKSFVREIHGYVLKRDLADMMVQNAIVNVYGEALELFYTLNQFNIQPDSIAFISALSATASLSSLKKGKEIRKGFFLKGPIASSLVYTYAHCGKLKICIM